jgi:hypothetical protein
MHLPLNFAFPEDLLPCLPSACWSGKVPKSTQNFTPTVWPDTFISGKVRSDDTILSCGGLTICKPFIFNGLHGQAIVRTQENCGLKFVNRRTLLTDFLENQGGGGVD